MTGRCGREGEEGRPRRGQHERCAASCEENSHQPSRTPPRESWGWTTVTELVQARPRVSPVGLWACSHPPAPRRSFAFVAWPATCRMGISEDSRGKTLARVLAGEATEPPVQCLRHWTESRSRGCKSGLSFLCGWRERGGVGEGGQKRAGIILLGRLQPMIVSMSQA